MNYKIFKLKSGEEIITQVKEFSKGKYIIEKPMVFKTATMLDPMGRPYDLTMLKDWLSHSDSKIIDLPKSHVATSFDPTLDTQKFYDAECTRMENKNKKEVEEKPINQDKSPDNFLEALFGNIFGDIQNQVEEQLQQEMENVSPPPELLNDATPKSDDVIPMVYINMMFPPEVILELLDAGLLDPRELYKLVRKIDKMNNPGKKKAKKKNPFPKQERITDMEKKVDDEPFGCSWKDWSDNPLDLLKDEDGLTGA